MASLKEKIQENFNVSLPISGGEGTSMDDAIIIDSDDENECISMEYLIVKYILLLIKKEGKFNSQALIGRDGRKYDKLSYVFNDEPNILHDYYFDITRAMGESLDDKGTV